MLVKDTLVRDISGTGHLVTRHFGKTMLKIIS